MASCGRLVIGLVSAQLDLIGDEDSHAVHAPSERIRAVAIENRAEHNRALKAAATLMDKQNSSAAETSLLKLLAVLIEDYEQKRYSMGDAGPHEILKELMRARGLQPRDLWPVFDSNATTSEVLSGKRGIRNEMARKLGELFRVSPAVFIANHAQ